MRSRLRFALFAGLVAIGYTSLSGPVSAARQSKAAALLVETMLTSMERSYCEAVLTKNPAVLDAVLAADFTSVGSDGTVGNRTEMLAGVKTSAIDACTNEDVKVRVYGGRGHRSPHPLGDQAQPAGEEPADLVHRYVHSPQ